MKAGRGDTKSNSRENSLGYWLPPPHPPPAFFETFRKTDPSHILKIYPTHVLFLKKIFLLILRECHTLYLDHMHPSSPLNSSQIHPYCIYIHSLRVWKALGFIPSPLPFSFNNKTGPRQ